MQTILIVVSVMLWATAAACAPSAFRGRRRPLFWFLIVFALSMTLQPTSTYYAVDGLLGNLNITYFLFHALAIVSIAILDGIVQSAMSPQGFTRNRKFFSAAAAALLIAVQAALFFGSSWHTSGRINDAFRSSWDYSAYAATTWLAMAVFAVSVAAACVTDMRVQRRAITRVSLSLIIFACAGVLTYAIISLSSAIQSTLSGSFVFQGWPRAVYSAALLTAPFALAAGLSLTATIDGVTAVRQRVAVRVLLWRITPLWERLLTGSPELSIETPLTALQVLTTREPADHLYRRHVEIRDSLLLNPAQPTSSSDRKLIDAAERKTRPAAKAETIPLREVPAHA